MQKYTDINFNFSKNTFTGDLNLIYDSRAIKQSIKNIILTITGERSFKPKFGVGLQKALFESETSKLYEFTSSMINNLNTNEPRIRVNKITPVSEGAALNIIIEYDYRLDGSTLKDSTQIDISTSLA